jgi:hypothetical protein
MAPGPREVGAGQLRGPVVLARALPLRHVRPAVLGRPVGAEHGKIARFWPLAEVEAMLACIALRASEQSQVVAVLRSTQTTRLCCAFMFLAIGVLPLCSGNTMLGPDWDSRAIPRLGRTAQPLPHPVGQVCRIARPQTNPDLTIHKYQGTHTVMSPSPKFAVCAPQARTPANFEFSR